MVRKPRNIKPLILILGVLLLLPAVAGPFSPVSAMLGSDDAQEQTAPADGEGTSGEESEQSEMDDGDGDATTEEGAEEDDGSDDGDPLDELTDEQKEFFEEKSPDAAGDPVGPASLDSNLRLIIEDSGNTGSIYGSFTTNYSPGDIVQLWIWMENASQSVFDPDTVYGPDSGAEAYIMFPEWVTPISAESVDPTTSEITDEFSGWDPEMRFFFWDIGEVPAGSSYGTAKGVSINAVISQPATNTDWDLYYEHPVKPMFDVRANYYGDQSCQYGCSASTGIPVLQPWVESTITVPEVTYGGQEIIVQAHHSPQALNKTKSAFGTIAYSPLPATNSTLTIPVGFEFVEVVEMAGFAPNVTITQTGPRTFDISDPGGMPDSSGKRSSTAYIKIREAGSPGSKLFRIQPWLTQAAMDQCCFQPMFGLDAWETTTDVQSQGLYTNIDASDAYAGRDSAVVATVVNGTAVASGPITATIALPTGAAYVSSSGTGSVSDNGDGTVTWSIPNLAAADTATLTLTVRAPALAAFQEFEASIEVASDHDSTPMQPCPSNPNASCSAGSYLFDGYSQDLVVDKPQTYVGDYLTYTMTVENFGCVDDEIPPIFGLKQVTSPTINHSDRTIRFQADPCEPPPTDGGVGPAAVINGVRSIAASAGAPVAPAAVGSSGLYAINTLPPGTSFGGWWEADQGDIDDLGNGTVRWNIGEMAPGQIVQAQIEVLVGPSAPSELIDRFELFDPLGQPVMVFNMCDDDPDQSCAISELGDQLPLFQNKFVDLTNAEPGDLLSYSIVLRNEDTEDLTDIISVYDELPEGTEFVSASDGGNFYSEDDFPENCLGCFEYIDWYLEDGLEAGETHTLTVVVRVDDDVEAGAILENLSFAGTMGSPDTPGHVFIPDISPCSWDVLASCAYTTVGGAPVEAPEITFGKSVDEVTAAAGDTLTYTLTARNTSNVAAQNLVGTDTLPAGVTIQSTSATNGSVVDNGDGTITWNIGELGAGSTASAQIEVTIDAGEWDTALTNRFSVDCPDCEPPVVQNPCPDNPGESCVTTETVLPTWTQSKTVDLDAASPGDTLTYSVIATNTGPVPVPAFTLTDTLPADVTFVSAAGSGFYNLSDRTVTWSVDGIPTGESVTYTVVATVNDDAYETTFSNRLVTTPPPDFPPPDVENPCPDDPDASCAPTTTSSDPQLAYGKIVDQDEAVPGDTLTYTLTASNIGNGPGDLVATDTLPAGVTFVSATATEGTVVDNGDGTITWTASNLVPNTTATAIVTVTIDAGQWDAELTNRLSVDCPDCEPPVVQNPCPDNPGESCVTTETPLPTWEQDKTVDLDAASPGDTLTYTVSATNTGPVPVPAFAITDVLPADVTFVSATGNPTVTGSTLTWSVDGLAVDETVSFTVVATVNDDAYETTFSNRLVTTPPPDFPPPDVENPCPDDPDASCAPTTTSSDPQLAYGKIVDQDEAVPGDTLTYTLTASNVGNGPGDLVATDTLPEGVTIQSLTATVGTIVDNGDGTITWTIAGLVPGDTAVATIVVTIDDGMWDAELVNRLSVDCPDCEPPVVQNPCPDNPGDSCASTDTPQPSWVQDKVVDVATAEPGDTLTYTVSATNTGPVPVPAFAITDVLPADVTFVSATGNPTVTGSTLTWSVDGLAVDETVSFTVVATVNDDAYETTFSNRLTTTPPPDFPPPDVENPCPDDPDATCAPTTVTSGPQLAYGKTVDADQAFPGDTLTYTLVATNVGNGPGSDLVAIDTLPEGVTIQSLTASAGTIADNGDGTVTWFIGTLEPDQVVTASITVTIEEGRWSNGLTNRFSVTDNPDDCPDGICPPPVVENPCPDNPGESCVTTEVPDPAMVLSKVARTAEVRVGDRIVYDIVVTNSGDFDFTDIIIRDVVPDELEIEGADFGGGEYDVETRTISWYLDRLDAGETVTFVVSFIIAPDAQLGEFENRVFVVTPPDFPPPTVEYQCTDDPNASCAPAVIVDDPEDPTNPSTTTTTLPGNPTTTEPVDPETPTPTEPPTTEPPTTEPPAPVDPPEVPVNVPTPPSSPPNRPVPGLPVTGGQFAGLLTTAGALIGFGSVLIGARRRRAAHGEAPNEDRSDT